MKLLAKNVIIEEVDIDPSIPVAFYKCRVCEPDGSAGKCVIAYIEGRDCACLELVGGSKASVEVELLIGRRFGRITQIGVFKPGESQEMATPFANLRDYSTYRSIWRRPNEPTCAVCWRPSGFGGRLPLPVG